MSTNKWPTIIGNLQNLLIWLTLIATWEVAFRVIGWRDYLFPAPSGVARTIVDLLSVDHTPSIRSLFESQLVSAIGISGRRLIIGFTLSVIIGCATGIALWRLPFVNRFLGPFLLGLQTLPSVCWVPLAVLSFGINETAMMFVMVMGSAFAVALAMRDGLANVPPIFHRAGLMLGARGWRYYRYILAPAALPVLVSSLRLGFSFAWRSLMGGELILATRSHGLGYLLEMGRSFADVSQVVGVIVIMIVIAMAVDRLLLAPLELRIRRRFGLVAA